MTSRCQDFQNAELIPGVYCVYKGENSWPTDYWYSIDPACRHEADPQTGAEQIDVRTLPGYERVKDGRSAQAMKAYHASVFAAVLGSGYDLREHALREAEKDRIATEPSRLFPDHWN